LWHLRNIGSLWNIVRSKSAWIRHFKWRSIRFLNILIWLGIRLSSISIYIDNWSSLLLLAYIFIFSSTILYLIWLSWPLFVDKLWFSIFIC
jgi:hypothetical protein